MKLGSINLMNEVSLGENLIVLFSGWSTLSYWLLGTTTVSLILLVILGVVLVRVMQNVAFELYKGRQTALMQSRADTSAYLSVLAREQANELIRRDDSQYLDNFRALFREWTVLKDQQDEYKQNLLKEITDRHPYFTDFDRANGSTRAHILYPDAYHYEYYDGNLWECYKQIRLYGALTENLEVKEYSAQGVWEKITEDELAHLENYIKALQGTKLRADIEAARRLFETLWHLNADYDGDEPGCFNTDEYYIRCLPKLKVPFGLSRGVYIKKSDRYGIWQETTPEDKTYVSYYQADEDYNIVGYDIAELSTLFSEDYACL
jgi:hypothetical protein